MEDEQPENVSPPKPVTDEEAICLLMLSELLMYF